MKREDCKFYSECYVLERYGKCDSLCNSYEQDPKIVRDNASTAIADKCRIKDPNYKRLYNIACDIIMNQHEDINKLKHDNNLMSSFIAGKIGEGENVE